MKFNRSDIRNGDRKRKNFFRFAASMWVLAIIIGLAFLGHGIYLAWHFISKGW